MQFIGLVSILVACTFVHLSRASIQTVIAKKDEGLMNLLVGVVQGAKQCGGAGEFVELRMMGCDPDSPCKPTTGPHFIVEIDFKPSVDMAQMKLKIAVFAGRSSVDLHDSVVKRSVVTKGVKHTATMQGEEPAELLFFSQKAKITYQLLNASDDSLDVCVEAEIQY